MTIPQFSTPHCHPQSLDTASTPQDFVERELELGSGTVTATDHGSMGICRHVYDIGRKQGLTPILGLEAYVRDDDDPILKAAGIPKSQRYVNAEGERVAVAKWEALPAPQKSLYRLEEGYWDYAKYAHLTVHFLDQEAYETGVRLLSRAELGRRERHGSEPKPLWSWAEVEELAQKNVTVGSSCLAGMVQQHLHLHQDPAMAEAYYRRLHDLFRGRLIVEVFPHGCSHYYRDEVTLEFADGTTESFPGWKNLATSASEKIKAEELVKAFRVKGEHKQLLATMQNRVMTALEKPKDIVGVTRHEGFVQNECLPWCPDGDVQAPCNRFVLMLAKKYGDPVLVSDDSHFSRPEGQAVQNIRLLAGGGRTWRFYGSYHRQSSDEAFAHFQRTLGTTESEFRGWVENSRQWAERFKDFRFRPRLSLPTKFYPTDTVSHLKTLIDRTGRMHWQDPRYIERLQSEIQLLSGNGTVDLLPYFFLAEDSVHHVEQDLEGLTGPGRGSAAGMLTLYLIGVTHVNPLDYDLSQDRFLTLDRIASGKLPDVDQDYTGPAKEELTRPGGWLDRRFGPEYHAQISVDTKLKLRSSVKDVARVEFGSVPPDIEALAARMRRPPQGIEDWDFVFGYSNPDGTVVEGTLTSTDPDIRDNALIEYVKKYPKQWETVKGCLGLTRQKGRHASAIAITGEPIANFIPLTLVSEVPVTQYVASAIDNSVEAAGAVKMDYLVINSLKDIEDCVRLIHKSEGLQLPKTVVLDGENVPWFRTVPWGGRLYDIWKLPNDDGVYASISSGDTDTVFQFCTSSARQWLQREFSQVRADGKPALASLENLAAFTALDRPGPLDAFVGEDDSRHNMLQEYARRVRGLAPTGETALLNSLCPETHGVIIYQEQLQRIFQEVGETTALEANSFRVHVSKKLPAEIAKDKIIFMRGALKRIPEAEAQDLWEKMQTFGAYGFNKSHAICYALIGYVCAWLKLRYPRQWWCAVLNNATKEEIASKFWRHCHDFVDAPDIRYSGDGFQLEGQRIRAPISLLQGIGEKAQEQLLAGRPYRDIADFCDKIQAHRLRTAKPMEPKLVKDKKTGIQTLQQRTRAGVSALNRGVVGNLIVCGIMDSLFPPEMTLVTDRLSEFERQLQRATGIKPPPEESLGQRWLNGMTKWQRYQQQKRVFPIHSQDLVPWLIEDWFPGVESLGKGHGYRWAKAHKNKTMAGDDVVTLTGDYDALAKAANGDPLLPGAVVIATVAYVKSSRIFTYAGGRREALSLVLDICGEDLEVLRWGGEKGLDHGLRRSYGGCIVLAVLERWGDKKGLNLADAIVVAEPLRSAEEPE